MNYVVIVAAGSGERLGAAVPKALVEVAGAPLVSWSLRAVDRAGSFDGVVIAAPEGFEVAVRDAVPSGLRVPVEVVAGGSSRQRSVCAALATVPAGATTILVHDAARPLASPGVFAAVLAALSEAEGAIAASPVADTLKRAEPSSARIAGTVDRAGLWRAETPQGFRAGVLRAAFAAADDVELDTATDCASMVEARGGRVVLVDSGEPNLKVTTPADAVIVASLLRVPGR